MSHFSVLYNLHGQGRRLQQHLHQWLSPHARWLVNGMLLLTLVGVVGRSLPYLSPIYPVDLQQQQQAIEFSDRTGLPLGTLLTRDQEHTVAVPLDQVSPYFVQAIIAAEDQRFYQHGPLDLRAIARASLEALQARQIVSGASTITMQLARMLEPAPRTLAHKAQEIWLAWRLGAGMTPSEILQAYINRLPMGGNVYGVEASARVYFGIPASDLTLAQATLLAALPNDPTDLNPYDRWAMLKQRQDYVLSRMVQDGYITDQQASTAMAAVVTLQPRQQGIIAAPHFLFWAASQLPPDHPPRLRTTLSRPLQQFVEAQVQQVVRVLAQHNVQQAAALVIDNHTGNILAYVGSVDYFTDRQRGRNDGVQALRQPGSTLKPFIYELALEQRAIRPNTVLADVPTYYAIPGAQLYSPVDYSETFQGPVRVRLALANSLNIPAVRVLEKVGVASFLDRLRQLGFEHLTETPEHYGLGLALGSGEVTLMELARAYLTLARQGNPLPLRWQQDNSRLALPPTSASLPPAAQTWALVVDMLGDRHARAHAFGVDSVLSLPFPAAVKTGTSSDFRDTWTVGFTSDYTVATWIGNFSGEPMRQISGVTGAAPLWSRILLHLHEHREPRPLPPPTGLVQRPICALSGLKPTPACPAVVEEYFYPDDLAAYDRQLDSFFQPTAAGPRLNLPAEYDEWLARQPQTHGLSTSLRIVAPRTGDYFLAAPASASPSQQPAARLEFKLATPSTHPEQQPIEWWLNGTQIATTSSSSYFWPLQPGEWTLEARRGDSRDRVQFEVGQADHAPTTRRGFSIAPPAQ